MTTLIKLKRLSWLVILTFFLSEKGFTSEPQGLNETKIDLLLAGGTLPICSSFSPKNCLSESFSPEDLSQLLYRFEQKSINRFQDSEFYSKLSEPKKQNINSLISTIYRNRNNELLSKRQISDMLRSSKYRSEFLALPDSLYFAMHDFFEVRQLNQQGSRKAEKVNFADSSNANSKKIFQTFYQQALTRAKEKGKSQPDLLVITASSRDPFESADFYLGVFAKFNANTQWLPLDASLQLAIETSSCEQLEQIRQQHQLFDRARIYPRRAERQKTLCQNPANLLKQIEQADGIFFNGGDQSRTLAALTNSQQQNTKLLTLIKQQVKKRLLIVAGTSAGTAVQGGGENLGRNVAMISNGDPEFALRRGAFASQPPSARCSEAGSCAEQKRQAGDLTYLNRGGTGLFNIGVIDTHFSERDREIRLAVLAFENKNRFGFGVDETTALAVSYESQQTARMKVIGENGVFVIDTIKGKASINAGENNFVSGISYYLNEGDELTYHSGKQKLNIDFSPLSEQLIDTTPAKYKANKRGEWRAQVSQKCGSKKTIKWENFELLFAVKAAKDSTFALNSKQQCSYAQLPFVVSR